MQPHIQAINIQAMMAEIEADMLANGVDPDSNLHAAYIVATLELNHGNPPNTQYVHNVLAASLNRPKATRH